MENQEIDMQIRKKEQLYMGKTLEELKSLEVREFAKLLPSNSRRNVLRNFQTHEKFMSLIKEKIRKGRKSVKTHKRDLIILPEMVGIRLQIYNGREFLPLEVTFDMIGHKFGEFSPTRSKTKHNKEEKTGKKKGVIRK